MQIKRTNMAKNCIFIMWILVLAITHFAANIGAEDLKSDRLCRQCFKCDSSKCPASEAFPHMTAFDDTLISGALQSDFVDLKDTGVYSVPDIKVVNQQSTMLTLAGNPLLVLLLVFIGGEMYLSVDKHEKVSLRSVKSLESLAEADWKSINPPPKLNHRKFRFWLSSSTRKCLTVFEGKTRSKRRVGVAECKLDGQTLSSSSHSDSIITKPSVAAGFITSKQTCNIHRNNSSYQFSYARRMRNPIAKFSDHYPKN